MNYDTQGRTQEGKLYTGNPVIFLEFIYTKERKKTKRKLKQYDIPLNRNVNSNCDIGALRLDFASR